MQELNDGKSAKSADSWGRMVAFKLLMMIMTTMMMVMMRMRAVVMVGQGTV
jgi:hypothetical protein